MWPRLQRWWGVILITMAVIATIWLAATQQLVLYIHPRYVVFTVVMAALALVMGILSVAVRPSGEESAPTLRPWARGATVIGLLLSGAVAVSLIIVPPATLSAATASQRDIVGSTVGSDRQNIDDVEDADDQLIQSFTVVDWASLLRQTSDPNFFADKTANVVGFITPMEDDPENMFFVSRFTVTCCAVDAQPTGIAVYAPNWEDTFAVDDWVEISGQFEMNPSPKSDIPLVLVPTNLIAVEQPNEPYLY